MLLLILAALSQRSHSLPRVNGVAWGRPLPLRLRMTLYLTLVVQGYGNLQSTAVNGVALEATFVAQVCDATLPNPGCNRSSGFHLPIIKGATR